MQSIDAVNRNILVAIELSASTWLVAARMPGSEKPQLHRIDGGDTAGLLALISSLRDRVARTLDAAIGVVCCFEAGRDGFWLHRMLTAHRIANHVLEPTSILVNRRARRAKTDRLDAVGMLRVLAAYLRGDRQSCHMVRVPTPEEEDAKRTHRERENLVQERLRIENRIEALLFTQGIRKRPSLRSWDRDLAVLRTGDGREMPSRSAGRIGPPASTARRDFGFDPGSRGRTRRGGRGQTPGPGLPQDRRSLSHPGSRRQLRGRAHTRGILSAIRQPAADCELRRHHADALPERQYGPRSAH